MSGFDVAAGQLIDYADKGMRPIATSLKKLAGEVPSWSHVPDACWPFTDGGMKSAYNTLAQGFEEALKAFGEALETSANTLKAGAKEYEKRDGEVAAGLQGR